MIHWAPTRKLMSRKPDVHTPAPRLSPERAEKVRGELERVLASVVFRASRRCQSLLRSITEHTIAGDIESLKERPLGVEVFGRPADYDTSQDPVVRASAAEIRKKLAQYYQEAGPESEARIELPPGSYIAEFHFRPEKGPVAVIPAPKRRRIGVVIPAATLLLLAAVAIAIFAASTWRHTELDDLWEPVLRTPGTVLVCMGLQAAYNLRSAAAQDAIQGVIPPGSPDASARPRLKEDDLILLRDRYVALDDALCLVRITAMMERYRKPYRIRVERSTSFADLRDNPAILIGAFDNPWTLRAAKPLRFTFAKDSDHDVGMVHDAQHPEFAEWKLTNYWPNWDISVDYAIVTRMLDSTSDRPVVIAAGLTQYGTIGAGEFLTNPQYFSDAVGRLSKDWRKKNLQIVLSVPVVNRTSGRPRVLATHVW